MAASTLAVVAVLTAGTAPAPAVSPAADDSAAPAQLRAGSYNIRAGVSTTSFRRALAAFLPKVDIAGLQEVNSHAKEDVLASLDSSGWDYFRPKPGEQSPVVWEDSRFTFLSGRLVKLADGAYIGREVSAKRTRVPAVYATVVRLDDRLTGAKLSVVNTHLPPGAVINGLPIASRPRLVKVYKRSVAGLVRLARTERAFGTVYTLGDLNIGWLQDARKHRYSLPFATFTRSSMRSMWATERPSRNRGSHLNSPALIDQVYATKKAKDATVYFSIRYSDHFPVVATYVQDPPAVP